MDGIDLQADDLEYVADMLRAIAWAKDHLGIRSQETLSDLEAALASAEDALRRAILEMPKGGDFATEPAETFGSYGLG